MATSEPDAETGGKAAAQLGADGKMVDADGQPLQGGALLAARLDAMKQTAEPSVNPFPDTGVTVEPREPPEPTVNPFPDVTPAPGPTIAVNPIPDGRVPDVDDDES